MATGKSTFKTPDQPNRVKKRFSDASPNTNGLFQDLPDLTPPRKKSYADPFASLGASGASPAGGVFGFPRLVESNSPDGLRSDVKGDSSYDAFRNTPLRGRSPRSGATTFSSPRGASIFPLNPPPVPIFQASPRRASDPNHPSSYLSPDHLHARKTSTTSSSFQSLAFSPAHGYTSPSTGGGALTSSFAAILGDGHSRVSPTMNAGAAAAAAVLRGNGGVSHSSIRNAAPFSALFPRHQHHPTNTNTNTSIGTDIKDGSAHRDSHKDHQQGNISATVIDTKTEHTITGEDANTSHPAITGATTEVPVLQLPTGGMVPVDNIPITIPGSTPAQLRSDSGRIMNSTEETMTATVFIDGADIPHHNRTTRRRTLDFSSTPDDRIDFPDRKDGYRTNHMDALLPIIQLRDVNSNDSDAAVDIHDYPDNHDNSDNNGDEPHGIHTNNTTALGGSGGRGAGVRREGALRASTAPFTRSMPSPSSGAAALAQSPISMRPGIIRREDIIDSPAVKEATNAAVAAAMRANNNSNYNCYEPNDGIVMGRMSNGISSHVSLEGREEKRRPRAAAAGAAAAAAAAASAAFGGDKYAPSRRGSSSSSGAGRRHAFSLSSPLSSFGVHTRESLEGYESYPGQGAGGTIAAVKTADAAGLFAPGLLSPASSGVPGSIRCNCKKSRCLKLYCECFKVQGYCGDGCSCLGCSNREDHAALVVTTRESILARNPQAFSEKITRGNSLVGGALLSQQQHRSGCNCKKSKCLKKYCECFQAGIACGDMCKCDGCHNTAENAAAGKTQFPGGAHVTAGAGAAVGAAAGATVAASLAAVRAGGGSAPNSLLGGVPIDSVAVKGHGHVGDSAVSGNERGPSIVQDSPPIAAKKSQELLSGGALLASQQQQPQQQQQQQQQQLGHTIQQFLLQRAAAVAAAGHATGSGGMAMLRHATACAPGSTLGADASAAGHGNGKMTTKDGHILVSIPWPLPMTTTNPCTTTGTAAATTNAAPMNGTIHPAAAAAAATPAAASAVPQPHQSGGKLAEVPVTATPSDLAGGCLSQLTPIIPDGVFAGKDDVSPSTEEGAAAVAVAMPPGTKRQSRATNGSATSNKQSKKQQSDSGDASTPATTTTTERMKEEEEPMMMVTGGQGSDTRGSTPQAALVESEIALDGGSGSGEISNDAPMSRKRSSQRKKKPSAVALAAARAVAAEKEDGDDDTAGKKEIRSSGDGDMMHKNGSLDGRGPPKKVLQKRKPPRTMTSALI